MIPTLLAIVDPLACPLKETLADCELRPDDGAGLGFRGLDWAENEPGDHEVREQNRVQGGPFWGEEGGENGHL